MERDVICGMQVDPANREAYAAWKFLLESKSKRLGVSLQLPTKPGLTLVISEDDAKSAEVSRLRRVS